jgi:hypothetical protein
VIVTTLPRFAAPAVLAGLTACAALQPPANPFAGLWTTPEKNQIAFRDDTVVVPGENNQPMTMSAASCDGAFRFDYGRKSRDALVRLAPHQPDLTGKLSNLLVQADYAVAELTCGEGASTYVLLDERDLVVIHRDRDIAAIERMSRL